MILRIHSTVSLDTLYKDNNKILDLIYTPGVSFVAKEISKDIKLAYDYTSKWNNVAIICEGTRVLGLGDIGPEGAIPVSEGKSVLFKVLGDINAYPLCLDTKNRGNNQICKNNTTYIFGAVNIEDTIL